MANYCGAILRYCLHIAGTYIFLSLFLLYAVVWPRPWNKDGEEEKLHSVLKTAEALVREVDDKLKKSILQKDIEQVSVAQAMLEAAR